MRGPIIAIDGPSGAGKGTVAKGVALRLGFRHVDSGAMYRAVAWKAAHLGLPLDDEDAVAHLAESAALVVEDELVTIDGEDVSREIRTPAIDRAAASVARLPRVRRHLVARQREYGISGRIVMEGRDIGTVVFPDADVKIYLDATPEERARRRAHDPAHTGNRPSALSEVATALEARDLIDKTRAASPLAVAADAKVIDTTSLPIAAVIDEVLQVVHQALGRTEPS